MDLHDAQYQGFFDIAFDNLYARRLLMRYIQRDIPDYKDAIVVSPDAGGAKRATVIADSLGLDFALIHKVSNKASHRVSRELHGPTGVRAFIPHHMTDKEIASHRSGDQPKSPIARTRP